MKRSTTTLAALVIAIVAALSVPVAQAANPSSALLTGLQTRGEALDNLCASASLAGDAYRAVCGTSGVRSRMTSGELNALEVRGQALDQMCASGTSLSRDARVALCGTGGGIVVGSAAGGFHWSDFGFGAGAMLGLALLVSGLAAGAYYSRRGSFRSRPVP